MIVTPAAIETFTRKGVLTGAYNFSKNAARAGRMSVEERLEEARAGVALFSKEFADGLEQWCRHRVAEHGPHQGRLGAVDQRDKQRPC